MRNRSPNYLQFGLSILVSTKLDKGNLIYMDLEKDEDLFKGQGDYQFDIYRKMRRQIGKDWTVSCSRTNLFVSFFLTCEIGTRFSPS